ncbi:MAG TPA: hypothetical protein VJ836_03800 [Candidatus Saccharimonadales bacterium]|nr:hypothetical protein [Candidatus Saccharimonadales bacterium]
MTRQQEPSIHSLLEVTSTAPDVTIDAAEKVQSLGIAAERTILLGNGALQCYQVHRRQPSDIDLIAERTVFDELYNAYPDTVELQYTRDPIDRPDSSNQPLPRLLLTALDGTQFDILTTWGGRGHADLLPTATFIRGVACADLGTIITWKRRAYRPKDIADLAYIEKQLCNQLVPAEAVSKHEAWLRERLPARLRYAQHPAIRMAAQGRFAHEVLFGNHNQLGETGARRNIRGLPFYRTLEHVDALAAHAIATHHAEQGAVTDEQLLAQIAVITHCTLYGASEIGFRHAARVVQGLLQQAGATDQVVIEAQRTISEIAPLIQPARRVSGPAAPLNLVSAALLAEDIVGPRAPEHAFYRALEEASLQGAFGTEYMRELVAYCQSGVSDASFAPITTAKALQFLDERSDFGLRRCVAAAYGQVLDIYRTLPRAIARDTHVIRNRELIAAQAQKLLEGTITLTAIQQQCTSYN